MPTRALIACHECDLLQRETPLPPGGIAHCQCCGGELYRSRPGSLDRSLAFTLAALVLFALANTFPIVGLAVGGDLVQTTLFGAVHALYSQGRWLVAGLVLLTTIITPLTELTAMAYLQLPLKFNRVPRSMPQALRILHFAREWNMVDVFMLGMLVALVKLSSIARIVPGIALWSFGALMLLVAAAHASFDLRGLLARAGAR